MLVGPDPIPLQGSWQASLGQALFGSEAEAAVCMRGLLRGLTSASLELLEGALFSKLFRSAELFVVVPLKDCEAASNIYQSWETSMAHRNVTIWRVVAVICTDDDVVPPQ